MEKYLKTQTPNVQHWLPMEKMGKMQDCKVPKMDFSFILFSKRITSIGQIIFTQN